MKFDKKDFEKSKASARFKPDSQIASLSINWLSYAESYENTRGYQKVRRLMR